MADSKTGQRMIPEYLVLMKNKSCARKPKTTTTKKTHNYGGILRRQRNQLREFPMVKTGTI